MSFIVTCMPGLASLLAQELMRLGVPSTPEGLAAVRLDAAESDQQMRDALTVCLWSRLAERVLYPLAIHEGAPDEAPELLAAAIDWPQQLGVGGQVHLKVDHERGLRGDTRVTRNRFLRCLPPNARSCEHSQGSLCLHLALGAERSEIRVDLSGEPLQRRGYRLDGGAAPLRETLAAAVLEAAEWPARVQAEEPARLVDPFCGSGTLLLEAAALALNIAPGLGRTEFGLLHWAPVPQAEWQTLRQQAQDARRSAPAGLSLKGFDADASALAAAHANAARAGLGALIHFERRELGALRRRDFIARDAVGTGLVVTNPPWGERLEEQERAGWLCQALGQVMLRCVPDWTALVIASKAEMLDRSGMEADAHWKVRNGPLTVYLRRMRPVRRPLPAPLQVIGELAFEPPEQAVALVNRLRKNSRQLRKWLDQSGVQAYRLYDRDLPEFNFSIDIYGDKVLLQEYAPPKSVDEAAAAQRRTWAVTAVRAALGAHREQVFLRTRAQQRGRGQYQKLDQANDYEVVQEGNVRLLVNLRDYLDSGLFLDHRPMRLRLGEEAAGARFLNLFGYTGAATLHAAAGGARSTVTVDASRKYLDWAGCNLALNGFGSVQHQLVRADVRQWVAENHHEFDLIFCDPPTFSNNKSRDDFVVQRDHAELIRNLMKHLAPGGALYFSCNFRRFEMDAEISRWYQVEDISRWSIPPDFQRNERIHYCFRISHGD
ncbi:bifunctional 23S rRNA (guanine(2069)-N(7))-methyltransferase RlmK/23S rRNA (guanine(2445)-N(2))-methyltransferase RlmL [Isoalcanivorax beigongshangi]|uniref:Bifunctional 23S rRNA (Guanine(2069)-N(7))-methyltransferase RlmK/23S rRNA (Guanine(2445)-N(2))-methyltransferase RlmL n=1 Tax=Isoalcanivorax beigongshangi TaxID=3238810 RepID=A0ABV4AFZ9_9GAMM